MLDPFLLSKFKTVTQEDDTIGEILSGLISRKSTRSILDIGAGPGRVSAKIANQLPELRHLTLVEPSREHVKSYPRGARVIHELWENVEVKEKFDLVLMSQVIGHFAHEQRYDLVKKALERVAPGGQLAVVVNANLDPYGSLYRMIADIQGDVYGIDSLKLEEALSGQDITTQKSLRWISLRLGHDESECLELLNAFFPKRFTLTERSLLAEPINGLKTIGGYVLPLAETFYLTSVA